MRRFFSVTVCALLLGCSGGNGKTIDVTGEIESVGVDAGSRLGGRVAERLKKEGDAVAAGEVLVRLEDDEAKAMMAAARGRLDMAEAALAKIVAGATPEQLEQAEALAKTASEQYRLAQNGARAEEIAAARAAADAVRSQFDTAKKDCERLEKLAGENAISAQQLDQARMMRNTAEGQYKAASEKLAALEAGAREEEIGMAKAQADRAGAALAEVKRGARAEDIATARAQREVAAADLARAEVALREMTIASPMDGYVESLDVHPGDIVSPGPLVRVVDANHLEMTVYVSAVLLGYLKPGQEIPFTTDSHGATKFTAHILRIAEEGEFTPRNLQTSEERAQQVFAVKLEIDPAGGKLRAGMTATAHFPRPGKD